MLNQNGTIQTNQGFTVFVSTLGDERLNSDAAYCKSVVLIVVVSWVNVCTVKVEVVTVGGRVLSRRPVVAVATLIVESTVPVATTLTEPRTA